jgi:hypothetical protein
MVESTAFPDFIRRIRAGDDQAARDPAHLDGRTAAPSPSRLVVGRELLAEVNRRLSEGERPLADLRADGYEPMATKGKARAAAGPGLRSGDLL